MAAGDVQSIQVTIGVGGILTIQPAIGNEFVIIGAGSEETFGAIPNGSPDATLSLFNGVLTSSIVERNSNAFLWGKLQVYITNDIYAILLNNNILVSNLSIIAMETK